MLCIRRTSPRAGQRAPRRRRPTWTVRRTGRTRSGSGAIGRNRHRSRRPPSSPRRRRPCCRRTPATATSHWPGRISTLSLKASAYRLRRAATVTSEPAGWVTGTGRRPNASQAPAAPKATTTSVRMVSTDGLTVCTPDSSGLPTTGSSQFCRPPPKVSRKPPTSARKPSTSIGMRHAGGGLVRVHVVLPSPLAVERHHQRPGHVERGQSGAEQRGDARAPSRTFRPCRTRPR